MEKIEFKQYENISIEPLKEILKNLQHTGFRYICKIFAQAGKTKMEEDLCIKECVEKERGNG